MTQTLANRHFVGASQRSRQTSGSAWIKILAALGVFAALLLVAGAAVSDLIVSRQMLSTLSNMKQLHLATESLALDGQASGDKTLGWPGDTGGTYTQWAENLVPAYLSTNDFCKLMSTTGKIAPPGKVPASLAECGVLVYAASTNSARNTVFLSTANFTNGPVGGSSPQRSARPYGNHGFVVFRFSGDGAILRARQASETNAVGSYAPLLN